MKAFGILAIFAAMVISAVLFLRPGAGPTAPTAQNAPAIVEKAKDAVAAADLANLVRTIQNFRSEHERPPASLEELVDKGYLDRVPRGVTYDAATGQVQAE